LRSHPSLQLEIISEARNVDLARREADICIRKTRSSSPVVVERAVGRLSFGLYAAQSYVDRRLRSGHLARADLARHDYIGHDGPVSIHTQTQWLVNQGATRFVFRSNSSFAQIEATLAGNGIAILADASVRGLAGLVRLGIDPEPPSLPIFLAFHRDLRRVPRIRLVLDVLDAALRDGLR
jgi:DNA-binding transcriptional LysR family regulator